MDNTDVLFGRGGGDLLVGNLGSDTLVGGTGPDILVGGPEEATSPNSDVLMGDQGDDVNVWAPGDGSDVFLGDEGYDTAIFAQSANTDGSLRLEQVNGRQIPRVKIDELPQFSCTIINVPPEQQLGAEHLVRFNVNDSPVVSVRLRQVEQVLCPSPNEDMVLRRGPDARLTRGSTRLPWPTSRGCRRRSSRRRPDRRTRHGGWLLTHRRGEQPAPCATGGPALNGVVGRGCVDSVDDEVDELVVEGHASGDVLHGGDREGVRPGDVLGRGQLQYRSATPLYGQTVSWLVGFRSGADQVLLPYVVPRRQPGLEQQHRGRGSRPAPARPG